MAAIDKLDPDRQLKRIQKKKESNKKKCIASKLAIAARGNYNGKYIATKAFRQLNAAICL